VITPGREFNKEPNLMKNMIKKLKTLLLALPAAI